MQAYMSIQHSLQLRNCSDEDDSEECMCPCCKVGVVGEPLSLFKNFQESRSLFLRSKQKGARVTNTIVGAIDDILSETRTACETWSTKYPSIRGPFMWKKHKTVLMNIFFFIVVIICPIAASLLSDFKTKGRARGSYARQLAKYFLPVVGNQGVKWAIQHSCKNW